MSRKSIIDKLTGSYEDWLIESLKDKAEAIAYLRVHLDEYEKSDSDSDQSLEIFHSALENVLKAQSKTDERKPIYDSSLCALIDRTAGAIAFKILNTR